MKSIALIGALLLTAVAFGQTFSEISFSQEDSLRGALRPERTAFDVLHYDLHVDFDIENQSITGYNTISFNLLEESERLQLDLFDQLKVDSITLLAMQKHKEIPLPETVSFEREKKVIWVKMPKKSTPGLYQMTVYYHGKPNIALNAPWDGGFVYDKDKLGRPFVSVACEGHGASSWWPLKDHASDEPLSADMHYTVDSSLLAVGNGKLLNITENGRRKTFHWQVSYPINSYNITFYIGHFKSWSENYASKLAGGKTFSLNYYVLDYNLEKAKKHFKQVKPMLACFEKYFGPYPYYRDGYKLVEAPYWGMEHQSAIAYGNDFKNNAFGFDFIIVHESGHEWWGNHVSANDHGDLLLHEAFTTYAEALYVEELYGYDSAIVYLQKQRKLIKNNLPIRGPKEVNFNEFGSADMYYKGSWMLHSFRTILQDDELWFGILRGMQKEFGHQTISFEQAIKYINKKSGKNYSPFFEQFIDYAYLPNLSWQYDKANESYRYKWQNTEAQFAMPIKLWVKITDRSGQSRKVEHWIKPNDAWQILNISELAKLLNLKNESIESIAVNNYELLFDVNNNMNRDLGK